MSVQAYKASGGTAPPILNLYTDYAVPAAITKCSSSQPDKQDSPTTFTFTALRVTHILRYDIDHRQQKHIY